MPARQRKTVYRPRPFLAEKNFVEIRFENCVFAVVILNEQRHDRFVNFAPQRTLIGQENIFDELLRERTAALHGMPCTQIGECRAHNAARR